MVVQHADAGAVSVGSVGVPFDAEEIKGVGELPSLAMGNL